MNKLLLALLLASVSSLSAYANAPAPVAPPVTTTPVTATPAPTTPTGPVVTLPIPPSTSENDPAACLTTQKFSARFMVRNKCTTKQIIVTLAGPVAGAGNPMTLSRGSLRTAVCNTLQCAGVTATARF